MKKIFTVLLATLMLLTSSTFMTFAASGPGLAEEGKGMNVTVTASQNANEDLVISVSGEQKEEFIRLVTQEGQYKDNMEDNTEGGRISVTSELYGWWDEFWNYQCYDSEGAMTEDIKKITREGDDLIIKKDDISKDYKLSSDSLTFYFWNMNENEEMYHLLDYEVKVDVHFSNAPVAKKFKLVNYILNGNCYSGASTKIDLSEAYLEGDDGKKIYPYSDTNTEKYFDIYWADFAAYTYSQDSNTLPSKTSDETFISGKSYELIYILKYETNNIKAFLSICDNTTFYENGLLRGTYDLSLYNNLWGYCFTGGTSYPNTTYQYVNAESIVTGSDYLKKARVNDNVIEEQDKKTMDIGSSVYEYLVIDQTNIDSNIITSLDRYALINGYTIDDIFNFKIIKNTCYGYYYKPYEGREITTLDHEIEFTMPIKDEIINTDPNIERKYKILYIDNNEIKTIDLGFSPYVDKESLGYDGWGTRFNISKPAGAFALVYKDTNKSDAPVITDGNNLSVTVGDKKDLKFTSNALIENFVEVKLDGKTLNSKYYDVKSGNTIVTLKADFVSTLSAGEHQISIVFTTGAANAKFTVNKSETSTVSKNYDAKDKNQDGVITCDEEMNSASWVWSTTKNACVYKVSNTSAK